MKRNNLLIHQHACCWNTYLKSVHLRDLQSLFPSCPVGKCKIHYRNGAAREICNWSCSFEPELFLRQRPYFCSTARLFWCSESSLLSVRWQQSKKVIAGLKLAPLWKCSHCRSRIDALLASWIKKLTGSPLSCHDLSPTLSALNYQTLLGYWEAWRETQGYFHKFNTGLS